MPVVRIITGTQYSTKPFFRGRVSVVIPVFNHEEFIGQAIESVLKQSLAEYEIIVVDDGSTDHTKAKVQPYLSRVKYIYKPNGGTASALNVGINAARGSFICWLSSDDQFLPLKLQKQIELFQRNPELGMVYTDWHEVDTDGTIRKSYRSPDLKTRMESALALMRGNCINGSTVMIKAECFRKVGGFRENYLQGHDHDMWLRLCRYYRFGHVKEPLLLYRRHQKNLSLNPDPLHEAHHQEMYQETRAFFNLPG